MSITPQAITGLALFTSVIGFSLLARKMPKNGFTKTKLLVTRSTFNGVNYSNTDTTTAKNNNNDNNIMSKLDSFSSSLSTSSMSLNDFSSLITDEEIRNYWLSKDSENAFLEDILSEESLNWVKKQNQYCLSTIGRPESSPHYSRILSILESQHKIPYIQKIGNKYYNFWQDQNNAKGVLRRTTLESYQTDKPEWETVIDFDELSKLENENWVYKGKQVLYEEEGEEEVESDRLRLSTASNNNSNSNSSYRHHAATSSPGTGTGTATTGTVAAVSMGVTSPVMREPSRVLLSLSRGGADAVVIREFDLLTKSFVSSGGSVSGGIVSGGIDNSGITDTDSGSIATTSGASTSTTSATGNSVSGRGKTASFDLLTECKSEVSWKSRDVLLVGADLKDGLSLTDSGYPRVIREWRRGSALSESKVLYSGERSDVAVTGYVSRHRGFIVEVFHRAMTFYTSQITVSLIPGSKPGIGFPRHLSRERFLLKIPADASVGFFTSLALITLRSDWPVGERVFTAGSLIAVPLMELMTDPTNASYQVIFQPSTRVSLDTYTITQTFLILSVLNNVKSQLFFWKYGDISEQWIFMGNESTGVIRGTFISAVDSESSDDYWLTTNSFTQPSALSLATCLSGPKGIVTAKLLKQLPTQFDTEGLVESQGEAVSVDGTKVPYFIIARKDMQLDGKTPTLLYGYGGFEVSMTPSYAAIVGSGWLERGGCYVVANIRGGGEFGPHWHQSALGSQRERAYEDFAAVAETLIAKKVTSPAHLAIRGESNGGLLVGNMIIRRPHLFAAACCGVPLLDMKRYSKLLAGASWMAEYGDPDKEEDWEYLQRLSPYHNIDPRLVSAGQYPRLLVTTSTHDDRVHPYHARCFTKRLIDTHSVSLSSSRTGVTAGCSGATSGSGSSERSLYYEHIEGGHGGASDSKQEAFMSALYLDFLWMTIGHHHHHHQ